MKPEIIPFAPILPTYWQSALEAMESPFSDLEAVLAWVELDLDAELRFVRSLLLVTEQGLIWTDGAQIEN